MFAARIAMGAAVAAGSAAIIIGSVSSALADAPSTQTPKAPAAVVAQQPPAHDVNVVDDHTTEPSAPGDAADPNSGLGDAGTCILGTTEPNCQQDAVPPATK